MRADLVLRAYGQTRRALRQSAQGLASRRAEQWQALQPALARTPALSQFAGTPHDDIPVTSVDAVRGDYGRWNSLGLDSATLTMLADASEHGAQSADLAVGWSTGSSGGDRGLFVADSHERADYIGQALGRLLPWRAIMQRQRIALHLRASNALYSDTGRSHFSFAHFPLDVGASATASALTAFAPTILIVPPHRLLAMVACAPCPPPLRRIYYGSEPMSAREQAHVQAHWGLTPQPIYQATEGFLGAACPLGRLHLNDHSLIIALEPVPGTTGYRPVITDLRRRSQPIVRVRGDDYLELDDRPCPCGYAGRVIAPIAGRVTDIWPLEHGAVTPNMVVDAVEAVIGDAPWKASADHRHITLRTTSACAANIRQQAGEALARLAPRHCIVTTDDLPAWPGPKRRKVVWHGA